MKKILGLMFLLTICLSLTSCGDDEPKSSGSSSATSVTEVKPEITSLKSATTKYDFTITFRVKSVDFPNVALYYGRESAKTSKPSLSKVSYPHVYNIVEMKTAKYSYYYYKAQHTGYRGGDYIYYQAEATNSKGSAKSSVNYCIIRR